MENKTAVVGIVITDRENAGQKVNDILSEYADMIVGRMGLPYKEKNIFVLSIIIDGKNDQIGALTGKLGNIQGVKAKVAVTY